MIICQSVSKYSFKFLLQFVWKGEKETPRLLNPLNKILSQQPFLMGDELNIADIAVGSILAYIPLMLKLDLSPYPAVLEYIQRLNERPAFQKTIGGSK